MSSEAITRNDLTAILDEVLPAKTTVTILFDNDSQPLAGAITLAESATNFDMLVICYKTNDGDFASTSVMHPNGKSVCLWGATVSGGYMYMKSRAVQINGNTIDTANNGQGTYYTGQGYIPSPTVNTGDYIAVTQVIGYKFS